MLLRFVSGLVFTLHRHIAILALFFAPMAFSSPFFPPYSSLVYVSSSVPGIPAGSPYGIVQTDQDSVTQSFLLLIQGTPDPRIVTYAYQANFTLHGIEYAEAYPPALDISGTAAISITNGRKSFSTFAGQQNPVIGGSFVFDFEFGVPQILTVTLRTDALLATLRANSPSVQGFSTEAILDSIYVNPAYQATYTLTPLEQTVPEPSSLVLVLSAVSVFAFRRKLF
jgi:hypothetical protein